MAKYILKRILLVIPVVLAVTVIVFWLSHMAAGDPARIMAEKRFNHPTAVQIEQIREEMGLTLPVHRQYLKWLSGALRGDFGISYSSGKPALSMLASRLPKSLKIGGVAIMLLLAVAFPLGILSAVYPGSILDRVVQVLSFFSVSMPSFWLALMLLYVFGVKFKVISVIGKEGGTSPFFPALAMDIGYFGILTRLIRTNLLHVLQEDYIRACRAKGLSAVKTIVRHGLRNAMLPILARMTSMLVALLMGSSIIESIFSIQGVGNLALQSVMGKDTPVLQCYIVIITCCIVLANLGADILYTVLDRRIRLDA